MPEENNRTIKNRLDIREIVTWVIWGIGVFLIISGTVIGFLLREKDLAAAVGSLMLLGIIGVICIAIAKLVSGSSALA